MDNKDDSDRVYIVVPSEFDNYRKHGLKGEDVLQFLDATGSGWIREAIEGDILDAEFLE